MKAIYQEEYSGTEFKLGEYPDPTPGDGEVLIRVHAAGVNPVDLKRYTFMEGETFPMLAGYDVAGVVESLGSGDVAGLAVGDKVFGCVVNNAGAKKTTGAFGELTAVPASLLARIPENATFEEMAATPVAVGTAIRVFDLVELKSGMKVFVSGGAGGVGVHAMQIAKNVFGAAEVATTASKGKMEFVKQYGADKVVEYRTEKAGEVLKGWADVAFDCTGEPDMAAQIVKEGGKARGIVVMSDVCPFYMLSSSSELMGRIADAVKDEKLKVVIDKVFEFDQGLEAIKYQAAGRAKGKVVIKMK